MYSNGNSFSFGASAGNEARPVPDWSPRSVPPWKFGLRQSDDRGSLWPAARAARTRRCLPSAS